MVKEKNNQPNPEISGYVATSVSISLEELEDFPALTVKENTQLIEELYKLTKEDKFKKRPLRTSNLPVKFYKSHEDMFTSIKRKLKEDNVSFSAAYKHVYVPFAKKLIKEKNKN
jgi:hypothetical protein